MPGPVVSGVRQSGSTPDATDPSAMSDPHGEAFLPVTSEGAIRLLLLNSGEFVMARLRDTTDRYGDPAFQLIHPCRVRVNAVDAGGVATEWELQPFLAGLTAHRNVVLFKTSLASVLEPDPRLMKTYAEQTAQECPVDDTPVERLKKAFQDFTDSLEDSSGTTIS